MNINDTFITNRDYMEVPYVYNLRFKNSTVKWSGTDTKELFLNNLKNESSRNLLKNLSWNTADIEYSYNSKGFRDQEFDNRECGLAIGCSFTEGVGLPKEKAWPSILSKLAGIHVWNLGSGGASIDTVFRIFEYYVKELSPKFVCILMPPPMRFEYKDYNNGYPIIQTNALGMHPAFAKDWLSQSYNGFANQKKNMLAIAAICQSLGVPLVFNDSQSNLSNFHRTNRDLDLARDLLHSGVKYQQYHAEYMFSELRKIGVC